MSVRHSPLTWIQALSILMRGRRHTFKYCCVALQRLFKIIVRNPTACLRTLESHRLLNAFISFLFLRSSHELKNVKAQWGSDLSNLAELQDVISHGCISNELLLCAQFLVAKHNKTTLELEVYHHRNCKHSRCRNWLISLSLGIYYESS